MSRLGVGLAVALLSVPGCGVVPSEPPADRVSDAVQQACWWIPEDELRDMTSIFASTRAATPTDAKSDALAAVLEASFERAEDNCQGDRACTLEAWAAYNRCLGAIVQQVYE